MIETVDTMIAAAGISKKAILTRADRGRLIVQKAPMYETRAPYPNVDSALHRRCNIDSVSTESEIEFNFE